MRSLLIFLFAVSMSLNSIAAPTIEPTRVLTDVVTLRGVEVASECGELGPGCVLGAELRAEYAAKRTSPDTDLNIFAYGSPWALIDRDFRFSTPERFSARVLGSDAWRTLAPFDTVRLQSSWSGVRMDSGKPSLAERMATALGVASVEGIDGFLWIKPDGSLRTTQQALTVFHFPFLVRRGDDVMISAIHAFPSYAETIAVRQNRPQALFLAGVSAEVFGLDRGLALTKFRAAAAEGHPIAAYNGASILLDRGQPGDRDEAVSLLRRAAASGDEESVGLLRELHEQ